MDRVVTSDQPSELAARATLGKAAPAKALRRRGRLGRTIVGLVFLTGLIALTYFNATRSRALTEAVDAEAKGDYPNALKAALEHLGRRPWSAEAARIAARCLSRLDFADEAEPYYKRARALTPTDLLYRAYGLTRSNQRDRALQAFGDVLRERPGDVGALRLQAGVLLSMTRWNDVIEIGRQLANQPDEAIEVEAPVLSAGHWSLKPMPIASVPALGATLQALGHHNQGDIEEAVAAFDKVLSLDPDFKTMPLDRRLFWSQYGQDLLSVGRSTDVIRLLNTSEDSRQDPVLISLVAKAQTQLGLTSDAENSWRKILELAPDFPLAWLSLGRIEMGAGHLEQAAPLLAKAASLAPDSVDAAYNLGLTYRRLGRMDEASKWEEEAKSRRRRLDEKNRVTSPSTSFTLPSP